MKKKEQAEGQEQKKPYIRGAGGTIVSKSVINGTAKLKWLFRQESEYGNGWIAFGDTDSQEYVNCADNMAVIDYNDLADIEPAVLMVYYMPVGSDLEFRTDETGGYFVDTKTGKEIREQVKHPAQIAFEKNMKFLNQQSYPMAFFQQLFTKSKDTELLVIGEADFPTGEVVLADPLAYLGTRYATVLDRRIPEGCYPVELSFCRSGIVGLRIAAARLLISDRPAVRYEIAMPKGKHAEDWGKPNAWTFFGVDTGLACFADVQTETEYSLFFENWEKENPGKNKYVDYFAAHFRESYEKYPALQHEDGSYLHWQIPRTEHKLVFFSSGMGDGIYSGYWGLDEEGEAVCLVIPFMNPEYFR